MYYLYHIRKTGGRSIIHSFLALVTNDPEAFYERLAKQPGHRLKKDGKTFVGWDISSIEVSPHSQTSRHGDFFFAFSHEPARSFTLPPQIYTITCLRDPLVRLQSYYNYLIDIRQAVKENPKHVHARMPDLAWAHDDQMKFLAMAPRRHLLTQLFIFSKQFNPKEAANNIAKVDCVLRTEKMKTDMVKLSKFIGIKLQPLHMGITKTKRTFSDDFLTEAKRILEPEFDLMHRLTDRGLI